MAAGVRIDRLGFPRKDSAEAWSPASGLSRQLAQRRSEGGAGGRPPRAPLWGAPKRGKKKRKEEKEEKRKEKREKIRR